MKANGKDGKQTLKEDERYSATCSFKEKNVLWFILTAIFKHHLVPHKLTHQWLSALTYLRCLMQEKLFPVPHCHPTVCEHWCASKGYKYFLWPALKPWPLQKTSDQFKTCGRAHVHFWEAVCVCVCVHSVARVCLWRDKQPASFYPTSHH